jgi:hypothetical protein
MDPKDRIADLAETFPSLQDADGVRPWDADAFDRWAAEAALAPDTLATARFILDVWDPRCPWLAGKFDLMTALLIWDEEHHDVFLYWAQDPWWGYGRLASGRF